MHTSRLSTRSIPFMFLPQKRRSKAFVLNNAFVKKLNIMLAIGIVALVIGQAILTNYLNTINFRLKSLQKQEETIKNDISALNAQMLNDASLEKVQEKARELGMQPSGHVVFISTEVSSFAKN